MESMAQTRLVAAAAASWLLLIILTATSECSPSLRSQQQVLLATKTDQDLVQIHEVPQQIKWVGASKQSELAPESQVVAVLFDHSSRSSGLLAASPSVSAPTLSGRNQEVTSATLSDKIGIFAKHNKTKQSQEFETHAQTTSSQQQSTITTIVTTTINGITTTTITSSNSSSSSGNSNSNNNNNVGPSTQESAQTAATATTPTTTSTTPQPSTPATSTSCPIATGQEEPAGSRTIRQGDAVLCGEANPNGKSNKRLALDRIVGGHKTEPGEFPFQVRLNIRSRRGSGICGGVIIDERHILTAAHCMTACVSQHLTTASIESSGVVATIGDHSIKSNDGEQNLEIERIIAHEKYDACNFYANDNDIAIVRTATPIGYRFTSDGYGSINRPCMPNSVNVTYTEGEQVVVSGWGVTRENSGSLSNILRYVQVPVVSVAKCQETYGTRVTKDHVCAGFQAGGRDSCQGDSGGPLVRVVENRYELVGVVSFGYGCGQPSAPGVYTRVASYIDWIKGVLTGGSAPISGGDGGGGDSTTSSTTGAGSEIGGGADRN